MPRSFFLLGITFSFLLTDLSFARFRHQNQERFPAQGQFKRPTFKPFSPRSFNSKDLYTPSSGLKGLFGKKARTESFTNEVAEKDAPQFKAFKSKSIDEVKEDKLVPAMTNGYPGFNFNASFLASNGEKTNAMCGGGLIDAPVHGTGTCRVLTAAHCFDTYKEPQASPGEGTPKGSSQEEKVAKLSGKMKVFLSFEKQKPQMPQAGDISSSSQPQSIDRSSFSNKDMAKKATIKFADFGEVEAKIIPSADVSKSDSAIIEFECNNEEAKVPVLKLHTDKGKAIDINAQKREELIAQNASTLYGKVMPGKDQVGESADESKTPKVGESADESKTPKVGESADESKTPKYGLYAGKMTNKNGSESTGNAQEMLQPEGYEIQQGDSGTLSLVQINGVWGIGGTLSTSGDNRKDEPIGSYAMVTDHTLKLVEQNVSYLQNPSQAKEMTFWKPAQPQLELASKYSVGPSQAESNRESLASSTAQPKKNPI